MALQFLRRSWSYAKVPASDETSSSLSLAKDRLTFGELVASRRFRWLTGAVFGILLFIVVFSNSDRFSTIRTSSSPAQNGTQIVNYPMTDQKDADWSRFAYIQYATDALYLCNSVMFFERLEQLQSKPDRVLLYPSKMLDPHATGGESDEAKLLILARDIYKVKLVPITVQHRQGHDPTWAESFTKLLSFNQTQYQRTLSIDSDSTLQQHMDELFLLPSTPLVATRAYWLSPEEKPKLSSQLMVIEPSEAEFARITAKINDAGPNDYDMEIIDSLYKDSAMILPHRPYVILTGTFGSDHTDWWLGNNEEIWDPVTAYNEAKLIHFSDWPRPKPWLPAPANTIEQTRPKCVMKGDVEDCSAREIWEGIYADFKARRKVSRQYEMDVSELAMLTTAKADLRCEPQ
ncbi:glucose N-acetyltransferase [Colletotrichum tofieldiae]|uniref:Glucose N-acetyltransferase n=1 Tax=Colletotrichum tofieldiae TaxID=708197 RepID=A0A166VE76_9PEZI|nr:glucose N-acetyltransferase [Colletotrichum tofieldiae]GKT71023.1 glucose N-acetyltransferase [Colletotrichum tofieldiae]